MKIHFTAVGATLLALVACGGAPALNRSTPTTPSVTVEAARASGSVFSVSTRTSYLLKHMKQHMEVTAYVTRGLPRLDAFIRALTTTLEGFKAAANGEGFGYTVTEARTTNDVQFAKAAGLEEIELTENLDGSGGSVAGFMGLRFFYGTEVDVIPLSSLIYDVEGLDVWLTGKVRDLVASQDDQVFRIGLLTGHHEAKLSEDNILPKWHHRGRTADGVNLQQVFRDKFPFYNLIEVDLKGGSTGVPEDLDGLLITQPTGDYSDQELRRIDDFVMRGKRLAVAASAVNVKAGDLSMTATLETHGLERLLTGYGIELSKDVVLDFGSPMQVSLQNDNMQTVGTMSMAAVPQLQDNPRTSIKVGEPMLNKKSEIFARLSPLLFPYPSSLTLRPERQPEARVQVLARTSTRALSVRESGTSLHARSENAITKNMHGEAAFYSQFNLAALVEGSLRSAFRSAVAPEKSSRPASVLVISSAQLFTNPLVRALPKRSSARTPKAGGEEEMQRAAWGYADIAFRGTPNTFLAYKNILDWLSADADLNDSKGKAPTSTLPAAP